MLQMPNFVSSDYAAITFINSCVYCVVQFLCGEEVHTQLRNYSTVEENGAAMCNHKVEIRKKEIQSVKTFVV